MFAQHIANFHVCLVLIFLLTRILCPLWLSISAAAFASVLFLFTQMPQHIKDVQWSDCMSLAAAIFLLLCCHAGALWCYPLTQSGKVRQWLWIKASRSNELITGGSAFSVELKALCYYVSYADKRHITRASREVHLTQFLSTIICWGAISIANWGWWTLIGSLTYSSGSLGLPAGESVQNANYLIINI